MKRCVKYMSIMITAGASVIYQSMTTIVITIISIRIGIGIGIMITVVITIAYLFMIRTTTTTSGAVTIAIREHRGDLRSSDFAKKTIYLWWLRLSWEDRKGFYSR